MKDFKFLLLLLLCIGASFSLSASMTIEQLSCTSIKITSQELACNDCYEDSEGNGSNIMRYRWRLQKYTNGSWNYVNGYKKTNSNSKTYNNLTEGAYRVRGYYSATQFSGSGSGCSPVTNAHNQVIGCIGMWVDDGFSNFVEIGTPEVIASVADLSGTPFNGVFCSGDPIYMDASNSRRETQHYISIAQLDSNGNQVNWTGTGWRAGEIGIVNLRETWATWHPDWHLWPGYTYRVMIALSSPCDGWESKDYFFEVVSTGCKTGISLETPLTIYPNPANNYINIKGYDDLEKEATITVFDLQGKTVKSETLYSNTLDISDLNDGMYLVQITNEEGVLHADKLMVRGNSK